MSAEDTRPRVLIVGAGVGGLEAALALRDQAGNSVRIDVVASSGGFVYRPLEVAEPFGTAGVERHALAPLLEDVADHRRMQTVDSVELDRRILHLQDGTTLGYDALILAPGAHTHPAVPGAITFPSDPLTELSRDVHRGVVNRLVFTVADPRTWTLPAYDLALLAGGTWGAHRDLSVRLVTPEPLPLAAFGRRVSDAVAAELAAAGVELSLNSQPAQYSENVLRLDSGHGIDADRVVALPSLTGPRISGLPVDERGFVMVDERGRVEGSGSAWAVGDATARAIKQGGLAAQQADLAVADLLAAVRNLERPDLVPFTVRGVLMTATGPRYLRAELDQALPGTGDYSASPLWWPPGKIAGRYLAPRLARHVRGLQSETLVDRSPIPTGAALVDAERTEAQELLLRQAELDARDGDLRSAVRSIDAAESVTGYLTATWVERREQWLADLGPSQT